MRRLISPDRTFEEGEFYWMRITSFLPGATCSIDLQQPFVVDALTGYILPTGKKPWRRFDTTGTVTLELCDDPREEYPGPPNPPAPQTGPPLFGRTFLDSQTIPNLATVSIGTALTFAVNGAQYGYLEIKPQGGNFLATFNLDYSVDNGKNWLPGPMGLDDVGNRIGGLSVFAPTQPGFTLLNARTFIFPVPGRTTHMRFRILTTATQTFLTLVARGIAYVPGVGVIAAFVLNSNTGGSTQGTIDIISADWEQIGITFTSSGGVPNYTVQEIDDSGALINLFVGAADIRLSLGRQLTPISPQIMLPNRLRLTSAAIVGQSTNTRVQGRR